MLGKSEHSLNREMGTTGDPRVADKLRIYRLVEQQFEEIESQVRQEVVQNVRAKAEARNKALTTSQVKKDLKKPQTVTSKFKMLVVILKSCKSEVFLVGFRSIQHCGTYQCFEIQTHSPQTTLLCRNHN